MTDLLLAAQRILDENNYTTSDCSLTNLEYIIKNAVDYINLAVGTSISFTPAAGAATLTATDSQIYTVKAATILMLRAYLDRGPNTSVAAISVSSLIGDPQYNFYTETLKQAIARLTGRSFEAV